MSEEQLRKEFSRVDKDNSGTITVEELRNYYLPMQEMLGMSPAVAEQEIRGLIKRLDVDNSGTIDFEGRQRIARRFLKSNAFIWIFSLEFKKFCSRW